MCSKLRPRRGSPRPKQLIFISGCDSGLGFSLAIHAAKIGFTVVAGFLSLDSQGAREIKQFHSSIKQIQLDVTNNDSIFVAVETINQYLTSNPSYGNFQKKKNTKAFIVLIL
jgi:NAD(P)-dependent dehydrogenase (short-subunit alcohol dehydrogenase family)